MAADYGFLVGKIIASISSIIRAIAEKKGTFWTYTSVCDCCMVEGGDNKHIQKTLRIE
jgi:hypothetical protein